MVPIFFRFFQSRQILPDAPATGHVTDGPFALGSCLVRPREQTIRRGARKVRIEPRIMQVLLLLARNAGNVVERGRFFDALWPAGMASDDLLNRCIWKLRKAFASVAESADFIETVPRLGYCLTVTPLPAGKAARHPHVLAPIAAAAAGLVVIGLLLAAGQMTMELGSRPEKNAQRLQIKGLPEIVPLTRLPGLSIKAALSPDGTQIAFSHFANDKKDMSWTLYVKDLASGSLRQFTDEAYQALSVAWSPNGKDLAYVRWTEGAECEIVIHGLTEKKARVLRDCAAFFGTSLSWSPDGKSIFFTDQYWKQGPFRVFRVAAEGGEATALTDPPSQSLGDMRAAASPDGRYIAFQRTLAREVSNLFVLELGTGYLRQLTYSNSDISGISWFPDSRRILFLSGQEKQPLLWSISVDGGPAVQFLEAPQIAQNLTLSRKGDILIFNRGHLDSDIWHQTLNDTAAPQKIIDSPYFEAAPSLSPDGRRLAFVSDRNGERGLSLADSDGRNLTEFDDIALSPGTLIRWSPDSRGIVFVAAKGRFTQVFLFRPDKSELVQITSDASNHRWPSFSPDGQRILFSSNRTGDWEMWSKTLAEGTDKRLTFGGGETALEAADGSAMFYEKSGESGIWRLDYASGNEEKIISEQMRRGNTLHWEVRPGGIYYAELRPDGRRALRFYDLHSAKDRPAIAAGDIPLGPWFAIAADESYMLVVRVESRSSDIFAMKLAGG